jgi:hypothetical protein
MVGYSRAYAEAFATVPKKRGRPRKHPIKAETPKKVYPDCRADFGAPVLMTDIKPFRSPIDGSEISSRSKLRAHEQRHGVKQNGDMKKSEIITKENRRIEESLKGAEMETAKWE